MRKGPHREDLAIRVLEPCAQINLNIPSDYDWSSFGAAGAISHLNRLINQLMEISSPKEPKSKMTFGGLTAGSSFNTSPRAGRSRFEITSEGDEVIDDLEKCLSKGNRRAIFT